MEGMYEDGEIIISVYEEEDTIKIDVADNGLGMTEDKLEYIMNHQVVSSKRGLGIGVRNVHERIQLIYGKQYGITITSELDEGTTATITIPKMEEADETE
jgi:two-component system, sensor histidine kinase YesM